MIYVPRNYENTCDVIDFDYFEVVEKIKTKMSDNVNPLHYLMNMHHENNTLTEFWPETICFKYLRDAKEANVDINILAGLIFLSEKAHDTLFKLLSSYGEFLKINVEGDLKYLFNPLVFGKEDLVLSERDYFDGLPVGYTSIVFKSDDVDKKVIFKSKLGGAEFYCNDDFVDAYNTYCLTGINFTPLVDFTYKDFIGA